MILFAFLTLSVGVWAQDTFREAEETVSNAANLAITEIQNASTEAAVKQIQDKAVADIQWVRDRAIKEMRYRTTTAEDIELILYFALQDIDNIKAKALSEIKGETSSSEQITRLDSIYSYDDDVLMMKAYCTYNNNGEISQRYIISVEYGMDRPYSIEVYDYNEAGLLTSQKAYDFVEDAQGEWQRVLNIETLRQYDAQGQLIKDTMTDIGEDDVVYGSTKYQYDENGNIIEIIKYESTKAGDVVMSESTTKTQVTYTANNQLYQEILYAKQPDSQWLLQTTTTYTYNEKDLLAEWIEDNEDFADTKMVYTYNDNNCLLTKIGSKWYEDEWELESKEEYTYDEHNNMKTYEIFVHENEEWKPRYKWLDTYTDQGWLETDTCYKYINSYGLHYIDEYTYDADGNRLSLISTDYENDELLGITKHQYFYSYPSTGLINVNANVNVNKFMHKGQLFIRKGGKTYTILGVEF